LQALCHLLERFTGIVEIDANPLELTQETKLRLVGVLVTLLSPAPMQG
jgi:hypothetical protein